MSVYTNTYINNIKTCLNRAIAIRAVQDASTAAYLLERCGDCNSNNLDFSTLQSWLSVVNSWNNSAPDSNVITEASFVQIIDGINVSLSCPQPATTLTITQQPVTQTITTGNSAILSVSVSGGTLPYTYQWQLNDSNIQGATNASYSASAGGNYRCVITDATLGTATTAEAVVTVSGSGGSVHTVYYLVTNEVVNGDNVNLFSLTGTIANITNGATSFALTQGIANQYLIFSEPVGEPAKTHYTNGLNAENMDDYTFVAPVIISGIRYYYTRGPRSFDGSFPTTLLT